MKPPKWGWLFGGIFGFAPKHFEVWGILNHAPEHRGGIFGGTPMGDFPDGGSEILEFL